MVSAIPAVYARPVMPRGRSTYNEKEPEAGTFGYWVFHRRWRQLGMTQDELAARIAELGGKMKQGDISDLELGKTGEPRRPRMLVLSRALEVSLETLYDWLDHPERDHSRRLRMVAEGSPEYDATFEEIVVPDDEYEPLKERVRHVVRLWQEERSKAPAKPMRATPPSKVLRILFERRDAEEEPAG